MNFLLNWITILLKYDTICLKVCCICTIKQIYGLQLDLEMQSKDALCVLVKIKENLPPKSVDLHNILGNNGIGKGLFDELIVIMLTLIIHMKCWII